jgi:hypothetical protein
MFMSEVSEHKNQIPVGVPDGLGKCRSSAAPENDKQIFLIAFFSNHPFLKIQKFCFLHTFKFNKISYNF